MQKVLWRHKPQCHSGFK